MDLKGYVSRRISEYYSENTFSFPLMKEKLPPEIYHRLVRSVQYYEELSHEVADVVAAAMKDWALNRGVTSYTHWFLPLTGLTAEKHDSFLSYGNNGGLIEEFTGSKLIKSEPDASSFPHGGMRSTFEARGYAAWDPSSPAFIIEGEYGKTLCIPSVFVSFDGYILDKKTPLIKSIKAVNEAACRLMTLMGYTGIDWVYPQVGPEQEYFLVDQEHTQGRPDLRVIGYTLFGQKTPRGQQFEDHYFGAIKERVLAFMQELEIELFRLGIPAKTRHNEVAPNQFEIATLHENANLAADHNQLLMEVLRRVARRHKFTALLHEKPFAGINGSGKHNNWSLVANNGINMFDPGDSRQDNLRFLLSILAVLYGVYHHGDLLRAIIASPGNDFRLGSHEAPPAIISVFLGQELTTIFAQLEHGELGIQQNPAQFITGVPFIPHFAQDTTDRNRTSPFAFTGNKFEFRAVGSSASIAMPNAVINTIVADGLLNISQQLEAKIQSGLSPQEAALKVLQETYPLLKAIHFEGDNYSSGWWSEAIERGLPVANNTYEALQYLISPKNINLFNSHHVLREEEVRARYRVELGIYINTVELELRTARNMIRTLILPACFQYERELGDTLDRLVRLFGDSDPSVQTQRDYLQKISARVQIVIDQLRELDGLNEQLHDPDTAGQAQLCIDKIRPALLQVREVVDKLEERVDARFWRLPRYWEMLNTI